MKEIKNVVILGGGTAGWLAAYIMSDFFYSNKFQLPEILSSCDLAVGGGGSMCWERAFLGVRPGYANN